MLKSGIYAITNRTTRECYIGQSMNLTARLSGHRWYLRKGKHHSRALQDSFDRHGESAFIFHVLERCEPAQLKDREYAWILQARPAFNGMVPNYVAIAKNRPHRRRLSRHRGSRGPNGFVCGCGQLKCVTSRFCATCARAAVREMVAAGYLSPPDEQQPPELIGSYGARPISLPSAMPATDRRVAFQIRR